MENSNNFFQLVAEFQKNIDWLNQVLKGDANTDINIDGVIKPSISKDMSDKWSAISAMVQGRAAYATKSALPSSPPSGVVLAEVWKDPIFSNNGLYGWTGSAWEKSPYDLLGYANKINDLESGFYMTDAPSVIWSGADSTISMKGTLRQVRKSAGMVELNLGSDWVDTSVPYGSALYWDLDTNTLVVKTVSSQKPSNSVLLAIPYELKIKSGVLSSFLLDEMLSIDLFIDGEIVGKQSGTDILLDLTSCRTIYALYKFGGVSVSHQVEPGKKLTLKHNDAVWLNLASNELIVSPLNSRSPGRCLLILINHQGFVKINNIQYGYKNLDIIKNEHLIDVLWHQSVSQLTMIYWQRINGSQIKVIVPENALMKAYDQHGGLIEKWENIAYQTFLLSTNESLWWDTASNTFITGNHASQRPPRSILIAFSYGGSLLGGQLLSSQSDSLLNGNVIVTASVDAFVGYICPSASTVRLHFKKGLQITVYDRTGSQIGYTYLSESKQFDIASGQALYLDVSTNSFVVADVTDGLPKKYIMMGLCINGLLAGGWVYSSRAASLLDCDFFMRESKNVTVKGLIGNKIKLDFSIDATFYIRYRTNGLRHWLKLDTSRTFELDHNESLYWDTMSNDLVVKADNMDSGWSEVLLAHNNYGKVKAGELYGQFNSVANSPKEVTPERVKMIDGINANQGMTVISNELLVGTESPDDHSTFSGTFWLYLLNEWSINKTLYHNLGHINAIDYNANNDALVLGNGSADATLKSEVIIIPNASKLFHDLPNNGKVDYYDPRFIKIPVSTDDRDSGLYKCNVCWADSNNNEYNAIWIINNDTKYIVRALLGKGSNDYSEVTGADDLTRWGSLITGKPSDQFNGTLRFVGRYGTLSSPSVTQGCVFHRGKLVVASGFDGIKAEVFQPIHNSRNGIDNQIVSDEIIIARRSEPSTGDEVLLEPEGVAVWGGNLIIGYRNSELNGIAIIALSDVQSGHGSTDSKVLLPFKMNSAHCPSITPTSDVTDLYVSSFDESGFEVASKSGVGSFFWELTG